MSLIWTVDKPSLDAQKPERDIAPWLVGGIILQFALAMGCVALLLWGGALVKWILR